MEIRYKSTAFIEDYMSGSASINESNGKTKTSSSVIHKNKTKNLNVGLIDTQETLLLY